EESEHLPDQWIFRQTHSKTLDPDVFGQIHVHERFEFVNVPELVRSEEIPVWTSQERAENHQQNPKNQETEKEGRDFTAAVFERIIAVSLRVRVNVRNCHQPDDDESGEHDAGEPGIE